MVFCQTLHFYGIRVSANFLVGGIPQARQLVELRIDFAPWILCQALCFTRQSIIRFVLLIISAVGDHVEVDEVVAEIETDKVRIKHQVAV